MARIAKELMRIAAELGYSYSSPVPEFDEKER